MLKLCVCALAIATLTASPAAMAGSLNRMLKRAMMPPAQVRKMEHSVVKQVDRVDLVVSPSASQADVRKAVDEINLKLSSSGAEIAATLPPNMSVNELVLERCGQVSAPTVAAVFDLNPWLLDANASQGETSIRIPPCVPVSKYSEAVWATGEPLADFLQRTTGKSDADTISAFKKLNPSRTSKIGDETTAQLPVVTNAIELPAGSVTSMQLALNAKGTSLQTSTKQTAAVPLSPMSLPDDDKPSCSSAPPGWPYDPDDLGLSEILLRYAWLRRDRGVIHVVDTGIPLGARAWLPLAINARDSQLDGFDDDANDYRDDVIGISLDSNGGFPIAPAGYGNGPHGLQVASIAGGRIFLVVYKVPSPG